MKYIVILLFILPATDSFARSYRKIDLQEALKSELNSVLRATSQLHKSCISQDEQKIETALQEVLHKINRANQKSSLASVAQPHLVKILEAAKNKLEMSQMFTGEQRRRSLQGAFKDLVQIAQIFKLDRYQIYFCSKDKSVWLQKELKPHNPIHPVKYSKCGRLVR